ncbi:DUF6972 family protein [Okeania sp.]|uniref:DUF6972 family protein n=1 Tax=Okeania sp. TaxID=3100323 RepID=UPI002B4AE40C|nr:hypothetical protein [Okeania sp.]MEB3343259.1 hypothetical protein [Okeania sp.]
MNGINRELISHPRTSLFDKHLPGTPQVARLLRKEGKAHVFKDRATMEFVVGAIIQRGELTGVEDENDDYERYGLYFDEPIGYQIRADGSSIPLYYAEIKIVKGGNLYHVIPPTKPR